MKDRITAHIFSKAEREGVLKEGMTVVAASSGNTGCSVAMMCAIKGYKAVVITNEKCSGEKRAAIKVGNFLQKNTTLLILNRIPFTKTV